MATKRIKEFLEKATLQEKTKRILENNDQSIKEKDRLKPTEINAIREDIVNKGQADEFNRLLDAMNVVFKHKYRIYFESIRVELFNTMLRSRLNDLGDMVVSLAKDNWLIEELQRNGAKMDKKIRKPLEQIAYSKLANKNSNYRFVKNKDGFIRIDRKEFVKSTEDERRRVRKERQWAKDLHMIFEEYVKEQGLENVISSEMKSIDYILYCDEVLPEVINKNTLEYYRNVFDSIPEKFADDPNDKVVPLSEILEVELFPTYEKTEVSQGILGENNFFTKTLKNERNKK